MSFQNILEEYRKISFSERDKGDRFERLIQAYLKTDPKYAYLFKEVWLWNEFPQRGEFGGKDTGIDLVALTYEGDYWAIQCKFYDEKTTIDKKSVDSFLSTSSRKFVGENLQTVGFAQRLWISTTDKWGSNAEEAIKNQNPPVSRLNLLELQEAPVDWKKLEEGITGELARTSKKTLRDHQKEALEKTHEHFKQYDRGKLIMACGTGKTFASLRIAENETNEKGLILFLVPSIALLGQTLREWTTDANKPIEPIAICSDSKITKKTNNDDDGDYTSVVDLAMPASTDVSNIIRQFRKIKKNKQKGMTVVFSTYQSIDVIAEAQKKMDADINAVFDLIICDEAHRTTGVKLANEDSSAFIKVHDNSFIKAKKRLYMTATPRLYSDDSKSKAEQNDAVICSMDDEHLYGKEIYRIGFSEAVERDLLTDYKVLILTLNDKDIPLSLQNSLVKDKEVSTDDLSKLIGCINALSKQIVGDEDLIKASDPLPMKRAVAFCQNIKISKHITNTLNEVSEKYIDTLSGQKKEEIVSIESRHIDGAMSAPQRDELLSWFKADDMESNRCRVLTNVRCLSEGVDIPSLDAVMFLSARNSQVDVVQSVGRVMRKAPNKKYGYIIIPVVIPANVEPSKALDDNERFKVVWTVLNALRAHDDRFNATINKIELNKKKPSQIVIGGIGGDRDEDSHGKASETTKKFNEQLQFQFEELQNAVYAKMVLKVGDRVYWEKWAKDVANIAKRQIERITYLVNSSDEHKEAFDKFLAGLQQNINPSITQEQAIEMLSQHIITKPVFEALFEDYSFVSNNPVSKSMQKMLNILEEKQNDADFETLQRFYDSVKQRVDGIDNAEGKQKIIVELYDKFFKTAFPKMVEQLGIVYTPIEIVDFIIHSVNDVLKKEFNTTISDENIHILDPFTGTGTFITRLIQSGLIYPKDLLRKYKYELHANEIVLLAYYIATVNIENALHDQLESKEYHPFEGIVLTDTFQLSEAEDNKIFSAMFPENSERLELQRKAPIRVIMGNPPYSIGQKSANDNAQNQKYPKLDKRVEETYASKSSAGLNKALYDAYIKAFRWSSDRLDKDGGIIAFVSNGRWIDNNSTDGFRKSLEEEFNSIWVFNLRGNQRTDGELSRKEGGKIFGSGSRTPIAITILVKNPKSKNEKATIYYYDIGDYLNREEKLSIISKFQSISNMEFKTIQSNEHGDWINQRNDTFSTYIPIKPNKKGNLKAQSFFNTYAVGVATNRDSWVYNYSLKKLESNMTRMIGFYNQQVEAYQKVKQQNSQLKIEDFIDDDLKKIKWTRALRKSASKGEYFSFKKNKIIDSIYRPFNKIRLYFDKSFIESPGLSSQLFPNAKIENRIITITGMGSSKDFSVYISDKITDIQAIMNGQSFPLYHYDELDKKQQNLFDHSNEGEKEYVRRDALSDFILEIAKKQYGKNVSKEDIFYYVYGFLHSPQYREEFANDLKKMLPRLPLIDSAKDFWAFSKAGRKLADLHINYESIEPHPDVIVDGEESGFFKVEKMRFPKKDQKETIIFNSKITVMNIPLKAYQYKVNSKSAIEWIMDRYQVKVDKKSGIKNDPNDWTEEIGNERYILDLLLGVINVSVQTVDIINELPKVKF